MTTSPFHHRNSKRPGDSTPCSWADRCDGRTLYSILESHLKRSKNKLYRSAAGIWNQHDVLMIDCSINQCRKYDCSYGVKYQPRYTHWYTPCSPFPITQEYKFWYVHVFHYFHGLWTHCGLSHSNWEIKTLKFRNPNSETSIE